MPVRRLNMLTARQVAGAKDGWRADGGGLYLRVSDNGARRRWVFRFTRDGKVNEIGLGGADAVTLLKARDERKRLADMLNDGLNPLAERKRVEAKEASRKTFAEVAAYVIDRDKGEWGANWRRSWERTLFEHSKRLGALNIDAITVEHVKSVVAPLWERGDHDTARRTLSRIETVLSCAIAHGWRSGANVATWSVFKHISPKRPKDDDRHYRMLPWPDAPAVIAKLREADGMAACAVEFAALTGVRISEAREATWSEFDFDTATWSIPKGRMKMREEHVVPMSRQALALLDGLKASWIGPLVFYGRSQCEPVSRMQCWRQCVRVTEGRGSPHGWRATFRSWCADNGVDREAAESALAHSVSGVEGAYQRASMIKRRRPVMQAWADHCDGVSGEAKVVPLRGKRR